GSANLIDGTYVGAVGAVGQMKEGVIRRRLKEIFVSKIFAVKANPQVTERLAGAEHQHHDARGLHRAAAASLQIDRGEIIVAGKSATPIAGVGFLARRPWADPVGFFASGQISDRHYHAKRAGIYGIWRE